MGLKFAIIETGLWYVPRNEIIQAESQEIYDQNLPYQIPGYVVFIEHPTLGKILYDTGNAENWETTWHPNMRKIYSFRDGFHNKLSEKLAEIGVRPADIDILILSHLHYDHAGNIPLFENTKAGREVVISKAEAHAAFVDVNVMPDGYSGAYWKPEFLNIPGVGYKLLEGDTKLADDLELFIQVGHTPGVLGMILKTEKSGNFIFCSDAIYSSLNFGPPVVYPGLCVDKENYKANVERVRTMAKELDAKVVFSHDVEDFKAWKKSPYFYK